MKIVIGRTAKNKSLGIDLDTLITTRLLIQANSGAGKSYLLRKLMEELFGHIQIIAIDPEGEFATLREKYGFVLVGKGGETPADARTAETVAHKLLELRASAICDLYEMRSQDRHAWVKTFLEAMINAPKKLWHPVIVIVDEAHIFCPEKGSGESAAKESMIDLTTRGRKRGFCAVWATQRLAKVDKDATSGLLNRLVGGTFEDVDIKRALDLLSVPPEEKREFAAQLRTLDPGWFFGFGRAISKTRVLFKTGTVATSHPQPGSAKHAAEPPPPPEKVRALLPKLADLPKLAEEKAKTVQEFKNQIAELRRQLATSQREAKTAKPAPADPARTASQITKATAPLRQLLEESLKIIAKITAVGFEKTNVDTKSLEPILQRAADQVAKMASDALAGRTRELEQIRGQASRLKSRVEKLLEREGAPIDVNVRLQSQEPVTITPRDLPPERAARSLPEVSGNGEVSGSQMKILQALAMFAAINRFDVPKKWIAAMAGASHSSSSFGNNLSALRTKGLIDYGVPGTARLTPAGFKVAPQVEPPSDSLELIDRCKEILSSSQARILDALIAQYPNAVDKKELANIAGASSSSSSYGNNLSALRSAGMIDYASAGTARAADWLFLE
jgi:Sec-independent protein translocase protein TatA